MKLRTYIISIALSMCLCVGITVLPVSTASIPDTIRSASAAQSPPIPPALLAAIIENKSEFNPNKISTDGCVGLGQLCKESSWRPTIEVQCQQTTGAGTELCSPNCDTSDPNYNWCDSCTGSASACVPDDRFNIENNISETARHLASKISGIITAGCDMTTEAGIKAAIYAYDMEPERLVPAITAVGCNDYEVLWQEARDNFTPITCTSDTDCGRDQTCQSHSEFTTMVCTESDGPLGTVYSGSPISLGKLNRKSDLTADTYVSELYADYERFGGATPNNVFNQITPQGGGCTPINIGKNANIGFPNPIIKIPGLTFTNDTADALIRRNPDGSQTLIIPFLAEYIAAVYRYAVGISVILAGIGVLVGGIMYITSGISNTQAQAVNIIQKSIIGMLLAVGSYTILYIINPNLVVLKPLEVEYVPGIPFDPDPILGETTVDTSLFGTTEYGPMTPGEWSPTLTSCPVNMPPLDPSASSAERDAYNYELYVKLKNVVTQLTPYTLGQRVVAAAEAASACEARFGSCGTTAGSIHAIAGSGDKHSTCLTPNDNDCNGNRGEVIFRAGDINRAFTYGHNCQTEPDDPINSHIRNNYSCRDPEIDGTYPRNDCTNDANEARRRVLAFFQQQMLNGELEGITNYPTDVLSQLRPGDYIVYYNGNKSLTGSHAVIFLGWSNEPGKAQVISGSASRAARPHTACLGSECGQNMLPITGAYRPGS